MGIKMYIIKDKNGIFYHCKFIKPLADKLNIDRKTLSKWFKEPWRAKNKGYEVAESIEVAHNLKGNKDTLKPIRKQ